jgi:hypothetical protein
VIAQVCASGGLKRESIRGELNESRYRVFRVRRVRRRNQVVLASRAAPDPHQRRPRLSQAPEDC